MGYFTSFPFLFTNYGGDGKTARQPLRTLFTKFMHQFSPLSW